MTQKTSSQKHLIELLFASLVWGFGFIATVWALPALSPAAIIFYRNTIAGLVCYLVYRISPGEKVDWKKEMRFSIFSGLSLGLCLFFQTWGLKFTTATNSGFITSLYVVMVPIVSHFFFKDRLKMIHILAVGVAIAGTWLLVGVESLQLNWGDVLTFMCAVMATVQIIYLGWIGENSKSSLLLNSFQSIWAGAPFLFFLGLKSEHWSLANLDTKAWFGLWWLGLGSSALAFLIMLRAQRVLSPTTVSFFYILESPIAAGLAVIFLNEHLSFERVCGAVLILLSCLLVSIFGASKVKNTVLQ